MEEIEIILDDANKTGKRCITFIYDNVDKANQKYLSLRDYKTVIILNGNDALITIYKIGNGNIITANFICDDSQIGSIKNLTHLCIGYRYDNRLFYNPEQPLNLDNPQNLY